MTAVAILTPDAMIDRIANGAFLRDLARDTGIDKRRLSEQLRKHPDYQAAKETSIEVQLDDAQVAILQSAEAADIARAREQFRAAAWRAEREFPHRWGQKSETHVITESYSDALRRIAERNMRVIDQGAEAPECGANTNIAPQHGDPA